MPRISSTPPPEPVPPASVLATARTGTTKATETAAAPTPAARPAAPAALHDDASVDAATVLARLRSVDVLLAALGRSADDLDRWLAAGLPVTTYRTPDGERLVDCAQLLGALAEPRPAVRTDTPAVRS